MTLKKKNHFCQVSVDPKICILICLELVKYDDFPATFHLSLVFQHDLLADHQIHQLFCIDSDIT